MAGLEASRTRMVHVRADPLSVYNKIRFRADLGDNIHSQFQVFGEASVGLLVNEKYGWRTNGDAALVIMVTGNQQGSDVTFTAAGGGEGLLRFDWGLHTKFLDIVEQDLRQAFPDQ